MILFTALSFCILLLLLASMIEFIREREHIAIIKTFIVFLLAIAVYLILRQVNSPRILLSINILIGITTTILFVPFRRKKGSISYNYSHKHDERDIMFSRNELKVDSNRYKNYYIANPQNLTPDLLFRKEPGLLSPEALYYHKDAFDAAKHSFIEIKKYHPQVIAKVAKNKAAVDVKRISEQLKKEALKLGALHVGITPLLPYHLYSHKGRGEEYGNEIKTDHTYALAFTVEMNHSMVQAAPKASIVMESAQQYLNSAQIATQLAQFIGELGFSARAHIDGNYQLICPLVAKDAGLGRLGRMGLLMTPTHGPRMRIGVVTTNMELAAEKKSTDYSVEQFCTHCKKCSVCCPSQSISYNPPQRINGHSKWQINSESCFTYWCKVGTDCGRCMAVCPYSHPNTWFHNMVRRGIKNNYLFLRLAVYFDDFFYGKKPKPKKLPNNLIQKYW